MSTVFIDIFKHKASYYKCAVNGTHSAELLPSACSKWGEHLIFPLHTFLTIQERTLLMHYRKDTIRFQVTMNDVLGVKITVK